MGQSFAEATGFAEHPWVMVRHRAAHVHMVAFRVGDSSEVWHGRNDRRAAQSACTRLELEHGLEQAPRRRVEPKLSVIAEREQARAQELALVSHRALCKRLSASRRKSF
ncbi:relaxase/mobilization nuclease domain-containing protein [Arthrobacter sp. PAMC 25486]|uniref:relaxase/mobilization nuclease domain-containing protein n=1 Tax=Arthrobacter sp. PAMC 25486 TaxID=1494608 RepID=UPI0005704011|nr:relaxase/mobilization nuclease domain-containing protein [Arthrobacter sp. PAMC 25486]